MITTASMGEKEDDSSHAKILRAAQMRLAEGKKLSLRTVAADAGVGLGTLTHYFINKQGLLRAIQDDFQKQFEALIAEMIGNVAGRPLSRELIADVVHRFYDWGHRNRWHFRMRISEKVRNSEHEDPMLIDLRRLNALAGKVLGKGLPHKTEDVRVFVHTIANSLIRSIALDTIEDQAVLLGRSAEDTRKALEWIHVELACGYLLAGQETGND